MTPRTYPPPRGPLEPHHEAAGMRELPEPSPAAVAAANERRPAKVQYCLGFPGCGGPSRCVDCRSHEEGPEDEAGGEQDGALTTREKIQRLREVVDAVLAGLAGKGFSWTDAQRTARVPVLRAAGVELVTANGAKQRGHVLKRGAKPVGRAYFGAPVNRTADLYVLHVQTKPATAAPAPKRTRRPRASAPTEGPT